MNDLCDVLAPQFDTIWTRRSLEEQRQLKAACERTRIGDPKSLVQRGLLVENGADVAPRGEIWREYLIKQEVPAINGTSNATPSANTHVEEVTEAIADINERCTSRNQGEIFELTNQVTRATIDLGRIVTDRQSFSIFARAL